MEVALLLAMSVFVLILMRPRPHQGDSDSKNIKNHLMKLVTPLSLALILPFFVTTMSAKDSAWADVQNMRLKFMTIYGNAAPPTGHIRFCRIYPKDCHPDTQSTDQLALSSDRWNELTAVNSFVNKIVKLTSDQELYGEKERWTYPYGWGDSEDYALLKRRMLMQRGWPASALLITVATDIRANRHVVLTVRTKSGDFILDNEHSKVLAWNKAPYKFTKRQSYLDPRKWVSLKPAQQNSTDCWGVSHF